MQPQGDRHPHYTIGVAERLTGLSARRIRYYEAEGLVEPTRSDGNQRLFTKADIEHLRRVKSLRAEGLSVPAIKAVLRIDAGRARR